MNLLQELNQLNEWQNLKYNTKESIIENSIYNHYGKESILFMENTFNPIIYIIISGYVVLSKMSPNGKEKYLYYLSKGDLVNESTIDENRTTTTVKTLPNADIISIPRDNFVQLMEEDSKLAALVINRLIKSLRRSQRQILNLGVYNIKKRTISKLLKLSRDYGIPMDKYTLIDIPLNQTDISNLVGASRESINRTLKDLENKEIICFVDGKIGIIDRDILLKEFSDE